LFVASKGENRWNPSSSQRFNTGLEPFSHLNYHLRVSTVIRDDEGLSDLQGSIELY
jgi:hypothetical protein